MISFFRKLWRNKRGNALVIAGAALPLVIGSAGLASDTIQWVLLKRQLQRAADSAAIAGVYARVLGNDQTAAVNTDLTKNQNTGYALQTGYPQITNPAIANTTNAVRVVLQVTQPLHFSSLFISTAPSIQASATAATLATGNYCVVSLENTTATGITASGNSTINLGCGMITNSTSLNAAIATGSSSVYATPIAAVGDIQDSSHWNSAELLPFTVAETDPFASVNPPLGTTFPGASCPSYTAGANTTTTSAQFLANTANYQMTTGGYYCMSSLTLNGTVTLPNGVYVIDGGDINIGSQANVTCAACTFVLTNRSSGTTATIGDVDINGGAELHLGPSTSGTYNNLLIYQDRRAQSSSSTVNRINGNSNSLMTGAMYFPNQQLDINGTAGLHFSCAQFVARNVNFSGNGSITNTCPGGYGPNGIAGKHVRLVA
jgi:Flp pilus assembly protein TadG